MGNTRVDVGLCWAFRQKAEAPTSLIVLQTSPRDATHLTILKIFTRSMLFDK